MKKHLLFFSLFLLPLLGMAQAVVLEDFEGGAKLPWNAVEGTYAVVNNAAGGDILGINSSAKAGSYTKKAGSAYSLFLAELPTALDLSTNNLFKIQVKASAATNFLLKLEGANGAIEGIKNIAVSGQWVEYTFNFSKAAATPGLKKIILFFDPGVDASADTYLFDNLTVQPAGACAGVEPSARILDDFECQRNISYGLPGLDDVVLADNPDKSGINTSAKVCRYKDVGSEYNALVLDWGGSIPLKDRNIVKIKVWAPVAGTLLVKLEGGTSPAKEIPIEITQLNKWVEYTINFSSIASSDQTRLVFFLNAGKLPGANDIYYLDDIALDPAPTSLVYEDFEGGAKLPWNAVEGTFKVVPNVAGGDTLRINSSTQAGAYTKKTGSAYSLFLAELATPLDLSIYNVFKVQVKAAVPTNFLLKLEGPNGAIEELKNIAVTGQWIEYTFNFSKAAAIKGLTKIILFFDPGVDVSADTYLFDNLYAVPAGACTGIDKDPNVLDDFECQRNITYGQPGYNDIVVVPNPDKFGANLSATVGKYKDLGPEYQAIVLDWGGSIPLKDRNQVKLKVWAPVAGNMLVKLEGGTSAAKEISNPITVLNKWVEYTIDFSDQANANQTRLVLFFNAGKLPGANDVYYVDDISLVPQEKSSALEDFEGGAKLFWEPLGATAVFGKYNGELANPDKVGNTSATIGSYTKGSSKLGGLKALLPQNFSLATLPQVNLQVWAPAGAKSVTLRLFSATAGLKEINRPLTVTGKWADLNFNFSNFKAVTDFVRVEIVFDPDLGTTDTWYFDNLTQTVSTVNLCEGTVAKVGTVDDFECQRHYTNLFATGGDYLKVIGNPDPSGINSSASSKVGEYTRPGVESYPAIVYDFGKVIDLSVLNQFQIKIWSPKAVPLLFKLEGGATSVEIPSTVKAGDVKKWVQYSIDFSSAIGKGNTKLVVFFNAGQTSATNDVYYMDDLEFRRAPYTSCITNFETTLDDLGGWQYFANGTLDGQRVSNVIDNPKKSGINTSNKVAEFIERPGGEVYAGYFNDAIPASVNMGKNKKISMKVLMDHEANVVFKLERSPNGGPNTGDTKVKYTKPNEWQELTWDYTSLNIPDGAIYTTLTMIMDFDNVPTTEKRYYFDDLAIGDKSCSATTTGVHDVTLTDLKVYPNPVSSELIIENGNELYGYDVFNVVGQKAFSLRTSGQDFVNLNTSSLENGMYILIGYDKHGVVKAKTRFVKQ